MRRELTGVDYRRRRTGTRKNFPPCLEGPVRSPSPSTTGSGCSLFFRLSMNLKNGTDPVPGIGAGLGCMRKVGDIPEDDVPFLKVVTIFVSEMPSGAEWPRLILHGVLPPDADILIRERVRCAVLRSRQHPHAAPGHLVAHE